MSLPIPFGNPNTYAGHSGIDYPQPRGTTFRASGPFTVASLGRNERGGFYIWVQYKGGPLVGYHHMDSHSGCPPKGSSGVEGDRLGYVGNSGHSTGPHLHSEVSGHATTAGYWQFFDRNRVVGSGAAAGGGDSKPAPARPAAPIPAIDLEEDDMIRINSPKYGYAIIGPGHYRELKTSEEINAAVSIVSKSETGTDRQFEVWRDMAMRSDFGPLAEGVWNHLLPAQDADGRLIPGTTYKAGSMQASTDSRVYALVKKLLGKS